jgi:hypothetical protein
MRNIFEGEAYFFELASTYVHGGLVWMEPGINLGQFSIYVKGYITCK